MSSYPQQYNDHWRAKALDLINSGADLDKLRSPAPIQFSDSEWRNKVKNIKATLPPRGGSKRSGSKRSGSNRSGSKRIGSKHRGSKRSRRRH